MRNFMSFCWYIRVSKKRSTRFEYLSRTDDARARIDIFLPFRVKFESFGELGLISASVVAFVLV